MSQPVLQQFERTKLETLKSYDTIKDLIKQVQLLGTVAETLPKPKKKQIEDVASTIIDRVKVLADQNEKIFNNYTDLTSTALRQK
jgi:hypothetical protein